MPGGPDRQRVCKVALFYLLFTMLAGAIAGGIAHLIRAVFNLYPDKISKNRWVNIIVSPGYSFEDDLLGVEFDDYSGYYKLLSLKNLKISAFIWTALSFAVFVFYPDHQALYDFIDGIFIGFADLTVSRWETMRLY